MINENIKCPFLIVSRGGILQLTMIIGHVLHIVDWTPNGLTLSMANPNLKCHNSLLNSIHLCRMYLHAFPCAGK